MVFLICGITHEICADGLFTLGIRRSWLIRVLIILVVSCLLDFWEVYGADELEKCFLRRLSILFDGR